MKTVIRLATSLAIAAGFVQFVNADTYYYNDAGSGTARNWGDATKWYDDTTSSSGTTFPNAVGDIAIFSGNATANTPAQTANRTVNVSADGADKTVGEIDISLDIVDPASSTHRVAFNAGSGGNIIFDGAGASNAKLVITEPSNNQNLVSFATAPIVLNDQLQVTVPKNGRTDFNGALRFQSAITGAGGITRLGDVNSLMNFEPTTMTEASGGASINTYTGPTYLEAGRTRIQDNRAPVNSSEFHIDNDAQVEFANNGSFQLGAGTLYLNSSGTGNTGGTGVLRQSRSTTTGHGFQDTVTNSTVQLQAPVSVIHVQVGNSDSQSVSGGFIKFTGVIAGGNSNRLQFTADAHNQDSGSYVLTNTNTFTGGVDLKGGRLATDFLTDNGVFDDTVTTANAAANFGAGDVHVVATSVSVNSVSFSRMTIPNGVTNAIANTATLWIDGNNDNGDRRAFAELGNNVTEVVGKLKLNLAGDTQLSGVTYGSTTSGAMFTSDTYFTGRGMIQVSALGDFDGDGTVGAGDYVVWRKSYSGNTALYDLWHANYGAVAPGAGAGGGGLAASTVPEPSTFVLLALTIAPLMTNRRRRFA